jgi:basic membrane protein A
VKRIDRAIAYLADLYAKDEIESQVYTLGFEQSDILYLGEFGDFVPEAVQQQAMETKQALANDEIQLT